MAEAPKRKLTRKEIESRIIARAMRDQEFRKSLLADPRTALEQEVGLKIPKSVDLKVHEESPTEFRIVLPPVVDSNDDSDLNTTTGLLRLMDEIDAPTY